MGYISECEVRNSEKWLRSKPDLMFPFLMTFRLTFVCVWGPLKVVIDVSSWGYCGQRALSSDRAAPHLEDHPAWLLSWPNPARTKVFLCFSLCFDFEMVSTDKFEKSRAFLYQESTFTRNLRLFVFLFTFWSTYYIQGWEDSSRLVTCTVSFVLIVVFR